MTTDRFVWRMEPYARRKHVEQFVGLLCSVRIGRTVDNAWWRGVRLIAVAQPMVGTVADLAIFQRPNPYMTSETETLAVSLASIRSIEETGASARAHRGQEERRKGLLPRVSS